MFHGVGIDVQDFRQFDRRHFQIAKGPLDFARGQLQDRHRVRGRWIVHADQFSRVHVSGQDCSQVVGVFNMSDDNDLHGVKF